MSNDQHRQPAATLLPAQVLFAEDRPVPVIAACEHFAGSEALMRKALALQAEIGPVFDVTCDCEDGAAVGAESEHVRMIAALLASNRNRYGMAGVRIHDPAHPFWREDVEVLIAGAGEVLRYLTIPKAASRAALEPVLDAIAASAARAGLRRAPALHVLIETHGALRDVEAIAALPGLEVLDFGLMDFVAAHEGAIDASAMKSPGQFEHRLVARAKAEVVATALAHGVVPAHNVSLSLRDPARVHADARRARTEFGFLRMWSIHPSQIRPIVEAMRPADAEVTQAVQILGAAQRAQWGPIQVDGELHDRATYRYYWGLLRRARATGMTLPPEGVVFFDPQTPL
jgi:citrate lyase subunit beta/citryl-CoA lyase